MNVLVAVAASMALITFVVHTFVGTKYAVPPLLAAEGKQVPKATVWLNYLCWHIVTGMLLVLALVLAAAALGRLDDDVVLVSGVLFAWVSIWSVITTLQANIRVHRFPASWLGGITALLAMAGWAL